MHFLKRPQKNDLPRKIVCFLHFLRPLRGRKKLLKTGMARAARWTIAHSYRADGGENILDVFLTSEIRPKTSEIRAKTSEIRPKISYTYIFSFKCTWKSH